MNEKINSIILTLSISRHLCNNRAAGTNSKSPAYFKTRPMNRLLGLFIIIVCSQQLAAQPKIKFTGEALSVAVSGGNEFAAAITGDSLFIYRLPELSLYKQSRHQLVYPTIIGFSPENTDVLIIKENHLKLSPAVYNVSLWADLDNYEKRSFGETPRDSIILWSISNARPVNKTAGNFYFDFFVGDNNGVYAVNNISSSFVSNATGDSVFYAKTASLYTKWDSDKTHESQLNQVVRKVLASPVNTSFTIVTYNSDSRKYTLSVRNVQNHSVIVEQADLENIPAHLSYSSDGKKLLFSNSKGFKKSFIDIIDIDAKKIQPAIPVEDDIMNAYFIETDVIGYATTEHWVQWNLAENRIEKQVSGNAFFNGFRVIDAMMIGQYLLVHTETSNNGGPSKKSELQLSALEDFAVFSDVKKGGITSFAGQDDYAMQLNDVPDFIKELKLNPAQTYFTVLGGDNRLQVWQTATRKKIFDYIFDNKVQGFVDESGRYVIVIEYDKEDWTRYRLHHIDLRKGEMESSDLIVPSQGAFKDNSGIIEAVAVPGEQDAWYVTDGEKTIWKFSGSRFKPEAFLAITDPVYIRSIQVNKNGRVICTAFNENREFNFYTVDFDKKIIEKIISGPYSNILPHGDGYYLDAESKLIFVQNGKIEKTIPYEGKFIRMSNNNSYDKLIVQLIGENNEDILLTVDNQAKVSSQALPERVMGLKMLNNGQVVYIGNGVNTFIAAGVEPVQWDAKLPQNKSFENLDVSASGRYILYKDEMIDLKESNRIKTDQFSKTVFLGKTSESERIELFSKGWDKNKYFSIRKINGADTIVSETKIPIPDNVPAFYEHNRVALSANKKWLATVAEGYSMIADKIAPPALWNTQTLKAYPLGERYEKYTPVFSSDSTRFYLVDYVSMDKETMQSIYNQTSFILDENLGPINPQKEQGKNKLAYAGQYNFEIAEFRSIEWKEPNSSKTKKKFYAPQNVHHMAFSEKRQLLFAGDNKGVLYIWDVNGASSPVKSVQVCNDGISDVKLADDKVYIFSASSNIAVYSVSQNKLLGNLQFLEKDKELKLAYYTPEKYFNADPEAMDALHFIKQGYAYPLSSYELQGNRPDKVYAAFGFADKSYIETLKKSWQTRLKRVGVQPSETITESHGPALQWDRSDLALVTKERQFQLNFSAKDTTGSTVTKLFIRVNGVPLKSRTGIVSKAPNSLFNFNENIELNRGKNSISVIAVNAKGEESTEQTHEVFYLPEQKQASKIVYVGVGVSEYKDKAKNLVYAAKDVKDIAGRLKYFADTVETITITDAMATKQGIADLKNTLKKTSTDDVVILSFSGHGMIDSANGFFFAPHDMIFDKPAQNGVSMTMIEDLLDDIPARKRLLLVDACHSGELLEGLNANAALPEGVKEINTKGVDKIKKKEEKEKEAERKGYMVMKDMFSDFSRGNGAFMISAAASNEFALESKQWNNGVFTASFLEALYEVKEKSSDKTIKVRELRKAIYEKVKARTKGQQTPTSRQENGWWNWSF